MKSGLPGRIEAMGKALSGEISVGISDRLMYATDASEYRSVPAAVAWPAGINDIKKLIRFAVQENTPVIPRGAGTSLAGQVVGEGIVVDIGRHMNRILEVNPSENWVRTEPGVVLDDLNRHIRKYGLFFGPETSTSDRCMIGGMAGNNACGSRSLVYGSTRDHIISMKVLLSDGSEAEFMPLNRMDFGAKCAGGSLESGLYRNIRDILSEEKNNAGIRSGFPRPDITRRNTGYAIDLLLDMAPFGDGGYFNFSSLIAGSEGTLAIITELKLNLVPLPPKENVLVCVHFRTLREAIEANLAALDHEPRAVELIDKFILDCTKDNITQNRNRFFLEGDPGAVLIIEFSDDTKEGLERKVRGLIFDLKKRGMGYHYPCVYGEDIDRVWSLRKAGLGVIYNTPGDHKPVSVIEDTAVHPEDMMNFINDFEELTERFGIRGIYHGHISTGELHLRPMINLKSDEGVKLFRRIALDVALLVKKYRGSLSGEHGDGRLRGEFIPLIIGKENYELLRKIKKAWDPAGIFNPGKIIDTPPMDSGFRCEVTKGAEEPETWFDFSQEMGFLRAVEKCNGSGDCRKPAEAGGTMCPSYMATRDERNTTRARSNILREFITGSRKKNPFNHREIYEVLDLCLSCKGCRSECPSSVDMAKLKAEFLQHWFLSHRVPLRTLLVARIASLNRIGSIFPSMYNFLITAGVTSRIIKKVMGFATDRSIPRLSRITLKTWTERSGIHEEPSGKRGTVYLFADEFSNFNETEIGIKAVILLRRLGYRVVIPKHRESGRAFLSKGLVKKASRIAKKNVMYLKDIISSDSPLIGIEPSGILTFRDEYPALAGPELKEDAERLAVNCLMFDEFICREAENGNIRSHDFTEEPLKIKLHGHCHQKAIASTGHTKRMLSLPKNYRVEEISSGCCGMAGSFGFEKGHYALSMKVGELVLFPAVRQTPEETVIAAPGTSCRQQILEGTGRKAFHPVEILYDALKKS